MTGLSVSLTSVSAVARGIAEAASSGIAANAQAATPISNKRFISSISLEPRYRGKQAMFDDPIGSTLNSASADLDPRPAALGAGRVVRNRTSRSVAIGKRQSPSSQNLDRQGRVL
jgi:hypothetical protein